MSKKDISVLVVDDDESTQALMALYLEPNYKCVTVSSAEQAVEMLDSTSFNLVLTDIRLPGASGLELCHIVQTRCPNTIVVIISGMTDIQYAIEAMRHGAFDYLVKPIEEAQLMLTIERALLHQTFVSELLSVDSCSMTLHALATALKKHEMKAGSH